MFKVNNKNTRETALNILHTFYSVSIVDSKLLNFNISDIAVILSKGVYMRPEMKSTEHHRKY